MVKSNGFMVDELVEKGVLSTPRVIAPIMSTIVMLEKTSSGVRKMEKHPDFAFVPFVRR
ncbi:MAG: hypothetical protein WD200_00515 [Candidatus Andersenbacteria bacterium]